MPWQCLPDPLGIRAESREPGAGGGRKAQGPRPDPTGTAQASQPGSLGQPLHIDRERWAGRACRALHGFSFGGGGSRLVGSRGEAKREAERRRPPCGTLRPWRRWVSFGGRRTQLLHPRPGSLTCCGRAGSSEPKNRPRGHLSPRAESLASPLRGQGTVKANLLVPGAPRKCPGHKAPL